MFYHKWAWPPAWSHDHHHLNELSFPYPTEASYEICLWLAQRFLRRWFGRVMVLGSFQCRGILLFWHMIGQGPAVLAAGAGRMGCFFMFSSPEPSGSQGELIVYPYSGVRCRRCRCRCRCRCRRCCQQCLNIFSSETALPIIAKFYVEPPWEGGTKVI